MFMERLLVVCALSGGLVAMACSPSSHEHTPRPQPPTTNGSPPTSSPVQLYCIRGYEELHVDADGDGYGDNTQPSIVCPSDGRVPVGYVLYAGNGYDCDDSDPTKFDTYYRDADGDGVGKSGHRLRRALATAGLPAKRGLDGLRRLRSHHLVRVCPRRRR
jgi:hypothetical protein